MYFTITIMPTTLLEGENTSARPFGSVKMTFPPNKT
jgi:hypothetical protein